MGRITLIVGGSRSGKSAHALKIASERGDARRAFIATAEISDEEMASRIARHRAERPGDFVTVEEPINLANAITSLKGRADVVVIDSLTLWVSNLMRTNDSEDVFAKESDALAQVLKRADFDSVVVTDEVGGGIVPANAVARAYRDLLGLTNQRIAHAADEVLLMVAGYPLKVK